MRSHRQGSVIKLDKRFRAISVILKLQLMFIILHLQTSKSFWDAHYKAEADVCKHLRLLNKRFSEHFFVYSQWNNYKLEFI